MALGFMIALIRNIFITSNELKNGFWNKSGGLQLSGNEGTRFYVKNKLAF